MFVNINKSVNFICFPKYIFVMKKISREVRRKGYALFKEGKVKVEFETTRRIHFSVEGETETHSVIFDKEKEKWSCDCRWSSLKEGICSHIYAAMLKRKAKN